MKIALLGGTGHLGIGLAVRFAILGHDVIVGSRKLEKAKMKAEEYNDILESLGEKARVRGLANEDAAREADVSVFTIPWEHAFSTAEFLKVALKDKIVVSPLVPMEKRGKTFYYTKLPEGSAAEKLASILDSKVVSAYQTIPAEKFARFDESFEWDVAVCGDDEEAKKIVIDLTNQIDGLRAFDAGPLAVSSMVESITPLLINIMVRNKMKDLGVKFVYKLRKG
ncbi:NADPH-dependent F420 reductase [Archaeoglobales archaeon]|nr:MAG: NADPH-dependent F420 reductase [Archaeoglobales archaeon]